MWLIYAICERHIQTAHQAGKFDNLPGARKPLQLDDDSAVLEDLRTGYYLLKKAGYLPPELALRKDALTLRNLLANTVPESEAHENLCRRLRMLELNLQQKVMSTDFLHGEYADRLHSMFSDEKIGQLGNPWRVAINQINNVTKRHVISTYQHKKGKIQDNVLEALLHAPLFRQRMEKNKKGKGSDCRQGKQGKGENWEASGKSSKDALPLAFCYQRCKTDPGVNLLL